MLASPAGLAAARLAAGGPSNILAEAAKLQHCSSEDSEWNAGYSSADSAGDDESAESMILDPGDGIFGLLE